MDQTIDGLKLSNILIGFLVTVPLYALLSVIIKWVLTKFAKIANKHLVNILAVIIPIFSEIWTLLTKGWNILDYGTLIAFIGIFIVLEIYDSKRSTVK